MKRWRWMAVIGLFGLAVAITWAGTRPPPAPAPAAPPRRLADSGARAFADTQLRLLDEIEALQMPDAISPATGLQALAHGAAPKAAPAEVAPAPPERQIVIGLTSGAMGEVVDCGCAHNPQGGLARRALRWAERSGQSPHRLLLDAGGLLVASPHQRLERPGEVEARAELIAKVYAHMGYAALNVGDHELAFGPAALRAFARKARLTLLASNLRVAATGAPAFEDTLIRSFGPIKVGIFGLTSPQPHNPGALIYDQGLRVDDPVQAARAAIATLRAKGAHIIVLVTQLRRSEFEAVVHQTSGIDLVLGSRDMEQTEHPLPVGPRTLFADGYIRGKYLTEVTIHLRGGVGNLVPADLRQAKEGERAVAATIAQELIARLEDGDKPDAPVRLTVETRRQAADQLAAIQARMQRLTDELATDLTVPPGASTVEVHAVPLGPTLGEDPAVAAWVKAYLQRFPRLDGR